MRPSGYLTRPDYRIDLVPLPVVVQARTPSRLIAATRHAVRLDEQNHEPVVYFPSASVDHTALVPMPGRTTHCPYKGDARYWAGRFSPDDVRQFRNELRQWQGDAQELRNRLAQAGVDPRELDQIIRDLKSLDSEQNFVDSANLLALQAAALDKLKRFEFGLRKKTDAENKEQLALSGSDEVPAGFRTAIEEYYRALARKR